MALESVKFRPDWYGSSIVALRQAAGLGVPDKREGPDLDLSMPVGGLWVSRKDLYVLQTRPTSAPNWTPVIHVNYAKMGLDPDKPVGGGALRCAFENGARRGDENTALGLLATVEAARSRVVSSIVQQMLMNEHRQLSWSELFPLLHSWGRYTGQGSQKRGRTTYRPLAYGPLRVADYYPEQSKEMRDAFETIEKRKFHL